MSAPSMVVPPSVAVPLPRASATRSLIGVGTPAALRLLTVLLLLGSVLFGLVGAVTIAQHASAAGEVVSTSEPLGLAAQELYQSLSDADITATTSFLAGPPLKLSDRQHYEADVARAAADLATLRSAGGAAQGSQLSASIAAISGGLPVYTGYVQQAQTFSSFTYPLTGGSFMQVASEEMHVTLLPAARTIYTRENAALTSASAQATGLPLIAIALLLAIGLGVVLFRAQRWLTRRTHRTVNYGLLLASGALLVVTVWMVVAFVSARSSFGQGLGHGSTPAEAMAQAGIAAQQGRGDQVLNLISRSGSSSFTADFTVQQHRIGPGDGTLLEAAASSAAAGAGASAVTSAGRDAKTWYSASGKVFALDLASNYAAETHLVIGRGADSSGAAFSRLESDIARGIAADQVVFRSSAATGSTAFDGLDIAVVIAALLMAGGSAWGLSRRLAEYR